MGRDNFPEKTGALLVCNHMSFVDVALLVAATDRPIRFLMYQGIYDHPIVKPFAKMVKAIPISSELHPREMLHSLQDASDALRNDEIVCIFAEGQITRTGQLLPFRRGLERIMKGVEVPIIPVNLDGVWGSIFSFERGRFLWKMPRHIPYPRHGQLRQANAADIDRDRSPRRGPGTASRPRSNAQDIDEDAGPRLRPHRPPASVAVLDGRRQDPESLLWVRAQQDRSTSPAGCGSQSASSRWSECCFRPPSAERSPTTRSC